MNWVIAILATLALIALPGEVSSWIGLGDTPLFEFVWIGSSAWVAWDSRHTRLFQGKSRLMPGPVVLFIVCTAVWPVCFPWYLSARRRLRAEARSADRLASRKPDQCLGTSGQPDGSVNGPSIETFPDASSLAIAVAAEWLDALRPCGMASPARGVALSGGRIARDFFRAVARLAKERGQSLGDVHFFWADERCVPPDHAESNYRSATELLLTPMGVPEENVHRIHGEEQSLDAAREAEAELRKFAPANAAGQPVLDLVLLGMGEDGHVASLFPGETEDTMSSPAVYRAVTANKPPPRRITLGYAAIAASREVWVLASGAGKELALRESLSPGGKTPLARVLGERSQTRIFTDLQT